MVDELTGRIALGILLLPGFDLWDLAITEEIVAIFNRQPHRYRFEIAVQGICDGRVPASNGVEVAAGSSRAELAAHPPSLFRRGAIETVQNLVRGDGEPLDWPRS